MGEVESHHELPAELPHNRGWYHALSEPDPEAAQGFAHELENQAYIGTVGALVLEIIHEMTYKLVASKLAIPITKMSENFPLE